MNLSLEEKRKIVKLNKKQKKAYKKLKEALELCSKTAVTLIHVDDVVFAVNGLESYLTYESNDQKHNDSSFDFADISNDVKCLEFTYNYGTTDNLKIQIG